MLGFAPISATPICALPDHSLGDTTIEAEAIIEARINNPVAEIVGDSLKQLVIAVEIVAVPVGP